MERLIRLLAVLVLASPIVTAGLTGRESAGPGVDMTGGALSVPVVAHHPSGPVNVGIRYRGLTARQWATKFVRMRHIAYRRDVRRRRDVRATIADGYGNSWLERAFLCIHRYEGSWTDTGSPYWGGLQMDGDFMRHYGGWALKAFGTADKWPVSVQISTAIQAKVSGRGFYPWPNTARACGLL